MEIIKNSDFIDACSNGHLKNVKRIININTHSISVNKGLIAACSGGHLAIVELMIAKGAKGVKTFNKGLIAACSEGHLKIAKLMIAQGVTCLDIGLETACHKGHIEIVKLMIMEGVTTKNYGFTIACAGGHIEIAKLIAPKSSTTLNNGLTSACRGGHLEIVKFIVGKGGATYFSEGFKAACRGGHLEIVKFLGKDINNSFIGFVLACHGGHVDICKFLVSDITTGLVPYLGHACENGLIEIAELLIEKGGLEGADLNRALAMSCSSGHFEIAELLISKGANDWNTSLKLACRGRGRDNHKCVKLILQHGRPLFTTQLLSSCIMDTLYIPIYPSLRLNGRTNIIFMLIHEGADIGVINLTRFVNIFSDLKLYCLSCIRNERKPDMERYDKLLKVYQPYILLVGCRTMGLRGNQGKKCPVNRLPCELVRFLFTFV